MNPKANEILFSFTGEHWTTILLRLYYYALSVSRQLRWRMSRPLDLPNGETVDSVVSDAIEKVFSGVRSWDPDRDPDLPKYLMDVIDSLLSHHATGADNRLFVPLTDALRTGRSNQQAAPDTVAPDSAEEQRLSVVDVPEWLQRTALNPEQITIEHENQMIAERALSLLVEECRSDPLLTGMLVLMQDGVTKPSELAAKLAVPVGSVYNGSKRLDRKLADVAARVRKEITPGGPQ